MTVSPARLRADSGIVLGPILFLLAALGIIGLVIAAGGGGFTNAGTADRIQADIQTQANLIRAKINECNLMYGTNNNGDGYPASGASSIAVSTIACSGDPSGMQNIWSGQRVTTLPPPTSGFGSWYYLNTNTSGLGGSANGGRCIWIQPNNPGSGTADGLTRAASKFTHATSNDYVSEVNFNPSSTHQRFVVWITLPLSGQSAATDCTPQ